MNEPNRPEWVPDFLPDEDSITYVQKSLATAFLIAAFGYVAFHVLKGDAGFAFRAAAGKGGAA